MILYIITNHLNGKRYVGITRRSLNARWREHCGYAVNPKHPLHFAMLKHGVENFSAEHVASARTWNDLQELERIVILQEGTLLDGGNGYNATTGGEKLAGYYASKESRERMALAQKGRKHSPEVRRKISMSHMGKKLSEAHKACVSAAHTGNQYCVGRILTAATKAKISSALSGRSMWSLADRELMSAQRKGRPIAPRSFKPKAVARRAHKAALKNQYALGV